MKNQYHFIEKALQSQIRSLAIAGLVIAGLLAGCTTVPKPDIARLPPIPGPMAVAPPTVVAPVAPLQPSDWANLPGWSDDDSGSAWKAFLQSCNGLKAQSSWQTVCRIAMQMQDADSQQVRTFFEENFTPYQVVNADGTPDGMITGYYEPLLKGSRHRTTRYSYPVYGVPDDLLVVDLASAYPELKGLRLRGRLEGNRVVPYYNRADIENGKAPVKGKELFWVDNPVDLFFLQIQGSGRIQLEDGKTVRVGYADQNGYPYKSIGKTLVERGELTLDKASMQGIKEWGRKNPAKLPELLNSNASYVFFRELPDNGNGDGPVGSLGVPITAGRSVAVDPRTIPLGAPIFLSTTWPKSEKPLNRLMLAQDTGGAIKGNVRADFFWGFGDEAGALAGSMKQNGKIWVLLPKGYSIP